MVLHRASGRKASYGQLAQSAALLQVPDKVELKAAKDFKYIGKQFKRTDTQAKSDGSAQFASDLHLPGQLTALIARPHRYSAPRSNASRPTRPKRCPACAPWSKSPPASR